MHINIYEQTKKYIRENYKFIITFVFIFLLFSIPTNYEIYSPGGLIDLTKRIEIDNSSESKGSFNLTYVGAKKGTLPIILLSYIIPNWDLVSLDESRYEDESYEEILARDKISLKEVMQYSTIVAFNAANKPYEIKNRKVMVYFVLSDAETDLKVGDNIVSINKVKIKDSDDLKSILSSFNVGDKLNIEVMRENKKVNTYAYLKESDGEKIIGLYLVSVLEVKTNPKVSFKYKSNEVGGSGGLMNALAIYDELVEEDITKGKIIAGTGTIDVDGNVGEISGIKYKLAGAVKKKADIFLAPSKNYEEAVKEKRKNNYKIQVIKADTFENVLNKLKNI